MEALAEKLVLVQPRTPTATVLLAILVSDVKIVRSLPVAFVLIRNALFVSRDFPLPRSRYLHRQSYV